MQSTYLKCAPTPFYSFTVNLLLVKNINNNVFFFLKESVVIKVDLHYTRTGTQRRHTESQHVDIGRPLVASCELYRGNHSAANKRRGGTSAQSTGAVSTGKSHLKQSLGGPHRPFTRKAECATTRNNEPEENDENEL